MTWTDQGLALRKALEAAVRGAVPVDEMMPALERLAIDASVIEELLAAHPIDEGPLNVTVIVDDSEARFRAALLADSARNRTARKDS